MTTNMTPSLGVLNFAAQQQRGSGHANQEKHSPLVEIVTPKESKS